MRYTLCLILVFLLSAPVWAKDTELQKIRRNETKNREQLYFIFSELPSYKLTQRGKRLDIVIDANLTESSKVSFEADDKIVKFLTKSRNGKTVFTFFLRYSPQDIKTETVSDTSFVLDILLGNDFTKSYPELATKLKGLEVIPQGGANYDNPAISSSYTHNWISFFRRYEAPLTTHAEMKLTVPPFPLLFLLDRDATLPFLTNELLQMSNEKEWEKIIPQLYTQIELNNNIEEKKLLAFTLGEVLFRAGRYEESYKQIYLLEHTYPDESLALASEYLLAHIHYAAGKKDLAAYEFSQMETYLDPALPLSPFILISELESAIAAAQYKNAEQYLSRDGTALLPHLAAIREMRRADLWFATGKMVNAYVGYTLLDNQPLIDEHPYSLNGYCSTLYDQKRYEDAATCYGRLAELLDDKRATPGILLKKTMAESHFNPEGDLYAPLSSLEDAGGESTVGQRASLKKNDVLFLTQPKMRRECAKRYEQLALRASDRNISEEAALKTAITYSELGEKETAVAKLMDFFRQYRESTLLTTAQALLIEILPDVLEKQIKGGEYMKAIVLAKQNRELFQNNWLDSSLLAQLADAYFSLSINDEARKLYLYLLKNTSGEEREKFFLPMIAICYNEKDYDLIDDYIAEYQYNYPQGKDKDQIFVYQVKNLLATGNTDRAKKLFPRIPEGDFETRLLAAALYYREENYREVENLLEPFAETDDFQNNDTARYMLAESYFAGGAYQQAAPLFQGLTEAEEYGEAASYRLATIKEGGGEKSEALKLKQQIVEKGTDPRWKELAARDLEFSRLLSNKNIPQLKKAETSSKKE